MNLCIRCNGGKTKDFAVCYDGSFICGKCLWEETEEIFGRMNANKNLYDSIKHSYEGNECLEVPVNVEEMCKFIDLATNKMIKRNFDYNPFEGFPDGGFLRVLKNEIRDFKLGMTIREYLKFIISHATGEVLEVQGWDTIILSHNEIKQVGLEHRLPACIAI